MRDLHVREFYLDLLATNDDKIVGYSYSATDCPLSRFIAEGNETVYVGLSAYGTVKEQYVMPAWANLFVHEISKYKGPVTKQQALAALHDSATKKELGI